MTKAELVEKIHAKAGLPTKAKAEEALDAVVAALREALASGESSVQRFRLTEAELGYFLPDGSFVFEPGDFLISVGPSSVLSQQVTVSEPQ